LYVKAEGTTKFCAASEDVGTLAVMITIVGGDTNIGQNILWDV